MPAVRIFNRYFVHGASDPGRVREINEDAMLLNAETGLCLLADGMGGHGRGDVASQRTVAEVERLVGRHLPVAPASNGSTWLGRWLKRPSRADNALPARQLDVVADIVREANRALYLSNREHGAVDGTGSGTTLVGCRLLPGIDRMQIFHVGDSRLYRWRGEALQALTADHSLYRQWHDGGQIGRQPPANQLYQAIGPNPAIEPEMQLVEIAPGDGFLMCSDGLTGMLEEAEIAAILSGLAPANLAAKTQALIDAANAAGGKDNITVVLICQ